MDGAQKIGYCELFAMETRLVEVNLENLLWTIDHQDENIEVWGFSYLHNIPEKAEKFDLSEICDELVRIERSSSIFSFRLWKRYDPRVYRSAHEAVWEESCLISAMLFHERSAGIPQGDTEEEKQDWIDKNSTAYLDRLAHFDLDYSEWKRMVPKLKNEQVLLREFAKRDIRSGIPVLKTTSEIATKVGLEALEKNHKEKLGTPYENARGRRPATYNIADTSFFARLVETFPRTNFDEWKTEVTPRI